MSFLTELDIKAIQVVKRFFATFRIFPQAISYTLICIFIQLSIFVALTSFVHFIYIGRFKIVIESLHGITLFLILLISAPSIFSAIKIHTSKKAKLLDLLKIQWIDFSTLFYINIICFGMINTLFIALRFLQVHIDSNYNDLFLIFSLLFLLLVSFIYTPLKLINSYSHSRPSLKKTKTVLFIISKLTYYAILLGIGSIIHSFNLITSLWAYLTLFFFFYYIQQYLFSSLLIELFGITGEKVKKQSNDVLDSDITHF